MAVFRRKVKSFIQQPLFIKLWLIPLWFLLGLSKALIFTVTFRKLAKLLGQPMEPAPWVPLLNPQQEQRALTIGRAVRLAAAYTPWDSNCFPQAIAARCLLGLYNIPYALFFGLQRDTDVNRMQAHAWVVAGKTRVTGGIGFGHFSVVGCFVSSSLKH